MTVLKYDDIIKKAHGLGYYFGIFWKIWCSATFKFHSEGLLAGSGFMMRWKPPQTNIKKVHAS